MTLHRPRTAKECSAWARAFALEPALVEEAVDGYIALLAEGAGVPPSDTEVAKSLARLRRGLDKDIKDGDVAPERAKQLDALAARLDSSIEHTRTLAQAGLTTEIPTLMPRLEAARTLARTLRAALARRAR